MRVLELLEEQHGTVSGTITLLDAEHGDLNIAAATGMTWQVQRRATYKVGEGVMGSHHEPDAVLEELPVDRLLDEVRGPELEGSVDGLRVRSAGDDEHRDLPGGV